MWDAKLELQEEAGMKSFDSPGETLSVLKKILEIEQGLSGVEYLQKVGKNIAENLGVRYVLIGHSVEPERKKIQTDVVWAGQAFLDNFEYELKDTPCEQVFTGNRVCVYPKDVARRFPEDHLLEEMGVQCYVGAPVLDTSGSLQGLLVLLHDQAIENPGFCTEMIEFLAMRIGAELDRFQMESSLRKLVQERTSALEKSNRELRRALSQVKQLSGLLPICARCKKIRDDKGYWNAIESYISNHSEASFSHSICEECADKLYGREAWYGEFKETKRS
jgi:transcriptional regulator with GAF, ATPase, and Fis domain